MLVDEYLNTITESSASYCDEDSFGETLIDMDKESQKDLLKIQSHIPDSEIMIRISVNRDFYFLNKTQSRSNFKAYNTPIDLEQNLIFNIKKHFEVINNLETIPKKSDFLRLCYKEDIFPNKIIPQTRKEKEVENTLNAIKERIEDDLKIFNELKKDNEILFEQNVISI